MFRLESQLRMARSDIQIASNVHGKKCRFENEGHNANKNTSGVRRRKKLQLRRRGLTMPQVYARLTSTPLENENEDIKLELNSAIVPCPEIVNSGKLKLPIAEGYDLVMEFPFVEGRDPVVETSATNTQIFVNPVDVSSQSLPPSEKSVQTEETSNFAIQMKKKIGIITLQQSTQVVTNVHQEQKAPKRYVRDFPRMALLDLKDKVVSKSSRKKLILNQIKMLGLQKDTNLIVESISEIEEEQHVIIKKAAVDLNLFCQSTPLHRACTFSGKKIGSKTVNKIKHLIRICPKLTSVKDSEGRTPLHYACATDAGVSVVDILLKENDNMCMIADNNGRLPLHLASLSRSINPDIVCSLCACHPDAAKAKDVFGVTPFRYMNYGKLMETFVVSNRI